MTSHPLYMKPHPVWEQHIHLTCDITATISVITSTVYTSSHPLFLWHHPCHMCGIVCIIQDVTSSLFDLKSQFWVHHTHYIIHPVHSICVITPTLSMISQLLYVWYHIQYMWDILSTIFMNIVPTRYDNRILCVVYTKLGICMTSFALQKTSHPLYHTKPQSLWLHIHFRHDITAPVSDITPTVSLPSQPLHWYHTNFWMTSHPFLCDNICTIYNITSNPYVIKLLYLWQHNLYIWNHIKYVGQRIDYTWDITATICVLTPTV